MAEIRDLATRQRKLIPKDLERAFNEMENTAGGREALLDILRSAPDSQELDYIIGAISDPTNDKRSLAGICQDTRIKIHVIRRYLSEAVLTRAQLTATGHIAKGLPGVVEHVMQKSVPRKVRCPACEGVDAGNCARCKKNGWINVEPNREDQKIALEMGKMINQKGGGILINNVNQQNVAIGADLFKNFRDATDKVLYGKQDIIDAEKI